MAYSTWRDLAVAYVLIISRQLGWRLKKIQTASTRSIYVHLRHPAGTRAVIRLSDHRSRSISDRRSHFSVRQKGSGRLRGLERFLIHRLDAGAAAAQAAATPPQRKEAAGNTSQGTGDEERSNRRQPDQEKENAGGFGAAAAPPHLKQSSYCLCVGSCSPNHQNEISK